MPINLNSLNAMQDNARVMLNNDGTFQKASFFSRQGTIDQNKQNIVNSLKQTIASNPKYFGIQNHLEGMIDGLMTSKLSKRGITAGQIKDILAYADSLSTPAERRKTFMAGAMHTALTEHLNQGSTEQPQLPTTLADSSKQVKDAYNNALHDMLKNIYDSTENLHEVNIKNTIQQFDDNAALIKAATEKLDMPEDLAGKLFTNAAGKNYSQNQLETLGGYYKEINDNTQINTTQKNILYEIAATKNGPLERGKFDTAVLAKENNFMFDEIKASDAFNTHLKDELSAMGFAKDDVTFIQEQITKSVGNKDVYGLVFNGTKATPEMIQGFADTRLGQYRSAIQEIKNNAGGNPMLEKIGMRTVADLAEVPKAGYLTELHKASNELNPAFIKELSKNISLDRFDTVLTSLAKAINVSSGNINPETLPELDTMKSNVVNHMLGECLSSLSADERHTLFDRLSAPQMANLHAMYSSDAKNADNMFIAQTLSFLRDQIGYMDNLERVPFQRQECDFNALPCSLRDKHSLDAIVTGDLPNNLYGSLDTQQYKNRFDSITQSMFQINFLAEMQKFLGLGKGVPIFEKDIPRDLQVTLSNGVKLNNDLEAARNQLASFITHGQVDKFAELTPAQNRTAQILMCCLSQETEKVVSMGAAMAYNGERNEQAFITTENREANQGLVGGGRLFHVVDDGSGGFEIQYQCTREIEIFQANRLGASRMDLAPGSTEHYELNIHIPGDELTRLQTVDFSGLENLPKIPRVNDLVDWHTNFNFGACNMQNVAITGGFTIHGIQ